MNCETKNSNRQEIFDVVQIETFVQIKVLVFDKIKDGNYLLRRAEGLVFKNSKSETKLHNSTL